MRVYADSAVQWLADLAAFALFRGQRVPCGTWRDRHWYPRP